MNFSNTFNVSIWNLTIIHEEHQRDMESHAIQPAITLTIILPIFGLIASNPKLRRKITHQLFMNLLITHIMINIAAMVPAYSGTHIVFNNSLIIAMLFGLLALTVDRVAAIKLARIYAKVKRKHIVIILSFVWAPSILFLVLSFVLGLTQNVSTTITIFLIAIAAITLISCNFVIYRVAKKHDTFLRKNSVRHRQNSQSKVLKASYVLLALTTTFVVLWIPFLVHNILAVTGLYQPSHEKIFTNVVVHLALLNSAVDVIIYVWMSRETKNELKKTLRCRHNDKTYNVFRVTYGKFSCGTATTVLE